MKTFVTRWLAAIVLSLSATLSAQAQLAVGNDYVLIEPAQPTDNPAKIEVIEFFSYACPHCSELDSDLVRWVAKLPADVTFKRVPVGFNAHYLLMARLYYALEAMGESKRLDGAVFNALHKEGLELRDEKGISEWVSLEKVDVKKFSTVFNSFGVISKVNRANQLAQASKISGVPAFVVDGRYLVVGRGIKVPADLLVLTDKVIDKRRAERSVKKK